MERCTNPNCTKTHCARHHSHNVIGEFKDYNEDNKFKCPAYVARFTQSKGGNPTVVAVIENGRVVRKLKWNY